MKNGLEPNEARNDEIKKSNRKALPMFILIVLICGIIGGVAGYTAAKYGLSRLAAGFGDAEAFFGEKIAPWLLLIVAIVVLVVCIPIYKQAKSLYASWDGEDEVVSDEIDQKLSKVIWVSSAALVFGFFLIAAAYSGGFEILDGASNIPLFFMSIVAFVLIMVEGVMLQQRCVDMAKKMNPEKKGSIYDTKFQKEWLESCDEAERIMIGKCALASYGATNKACAILAAALAICALIFGIGFVPSLAVCVIWLVNMYAYYKEAAKYNKAGYKLF
ncbi:DUF3169 family protein [Erysipelotrichaceae bacterium RD49]|nr:DUF3169 family protein [Erysipelotrichaceae bacterium RD49]